MSRIADISRVRVDLGRQTVLDDLTLQLNAGQVVGVTGPNGSGKTTLVRVLATLIRANAGSGSILGADITTDEIYAIRRRVGLIGHNPALLAHLTLQENLEHAVRLAGLAIERVQPALHTVGLEEVGDRAAEESSFGMKRRLEVARLLLIRPQLLLLDEAGSGLDADALELIDALVELTTSRGGGVMMVSHDLAGLFRSCDWVSTLSEGRLETVS